MREHVARADVESWPALQQNRFSCMVQEAHTDLSVCNYNYVHVYVIIFRT